MKDEMEFSIKNNAWTLKALSQDPQNNLLEKNLEAARAKLGNWYSICIWFKDQKMC